MNDFEPGDLVVCIDTHAPCCGDTTLRANTLPQPILNQLYVVGPVGVARCNACGADLLAFEPVGFVQGEWAWPQLIFRKIDKQPKDPANNCRRQLVDA